METYVTVVYETVEEAQKYVPLCISDHLSAFGWFVFVWCNVTRVIFYLYSSLMVH